LPKRIAKIKQVFDSAKFSRKKFEKFYFIHTAVTALQHYLLCSREPLFSKAGAKIEPFLIRSK
jgi:hypothetical protein